VLAFVKNRRRCKLIIFVLFRQRRYGGQSSLYKKQLKEKKKGKGQQKPTKPELKLTWTIGDINKDQNDFISVEAFTEYFEGEKDTFCVDKHGDSDSCGDNVHVTYVGKEDLYRPPDLPELTLKPHERRLTTDKVEVTNLVAKWLKLTALSIDVEGYNIDKYHGIRVLQVLSNSLSHIWQGFSLYSSTGACHIPRLLYSNIAK
jgi:hypothetical protein